MISKMSKRGIDLTEDTINCRYTVRNSVRLNYTIDIRRILRDSEEGDDENIKSIKHEMCKRAWDINEVGDLRDLVLVIVRDASVIEEKLSEANKKNQELENKNGELEDDNRELKHQLKELGMEKQKIAKEEKKEKESRKKVLRELKKNEGVWVEKECCFCLKELKEINSVTLPCGHRCLHAPCFFSSKIHACPICRKEVGDVEQQ
jgi:Zinc finger, C3HC4 type (RING finger)